MDGDAATDGEVQSAGARSSLMPVARVLLFLCLCGVPLVGLSETESREPATYASEVLTLEQARPLTLVGSSQLRVAFFKVFNSKLFTKTGQ